MEFAYLDESGDVGAKGSKTLVLTLVCTRKKKKLDQIITNTKKKLLNKKKNKNWLNRNGGEIKFHSFPDDKILTNMLTELSKVDMTVYYYIINKKGKSIDFKLKLEILSHLFFHTIVRSKKQAPNQILADLNFFNKQKVNYFHLLKMTYGVIQNLEDEKDFDWSGNCTFLPIDEEQYKDLKRDPESILLKIEHFNSRFSEALQATDIISGCCFQYSEYGNGKFLEILSKNKAIIQIKSE